MPGGANAYPAYKPFVGPCKRSAAGQGILSLTFMQVGGGRV